MRIGFADDDALQVQELAVYGFEEGEEGAAVREFGGDAFFEYGEELVEGAVEGLRRALGMRGAEYGAEYGAEGGWEVGGGVLEEAQMGEEGVDVCKGGGEGGWIEGLEGVEFAFGPVHYYEDAVDVAVDVCEEFCKFDGEGFEGVGEGV